MLKITGQDLARVSSVSGETAAGIDQWAPGDLKLFSPLAFEWIANLLNLIEEGAEWPKQMCTARAAFLVKEVDGDMDPLSYRVLLMLPSIYRLWAQVGLQHVQPWIKQWDLDEICAGTKGKGAQDATYQTALEMELFKMEGTPFTGGSADIYKCFDQVVRTILDYVLKQAGMPTKVQRAYMKYINGPSVINCIAGIVGVPFSKPTGIPQGDPFSMMVVAILLRAWVVQMKEMKVIPRLLADDLLAMAKQIEAGDIFTGTWGASGNTNPGSTAFVGTQSSSGDHLVKAVDAFDCTHAHLN